jgi:hypothetical protein
MISQRFCRFTARGLAGVLALLLAVPAMRAQQVAAVPEGAVDLGAVPAAMQVSVRLYLQPDAARVAALDAFLVDVQDVRSPAFRQWLKPAEFGARFGADAGALAQVRAFAESRGLSVAGASGLRVTLAGTATQMEAAFAPGLHAFATASARAMANTAVPVMPAALAARVVATGGFDTLTPDLTEQLGDAVDGNTLRVVALKSSVCVKDVSAAEQAAFALEAKQAAAQGITVLATSGCAGGASFPAALAEVTAIAVVPAPAEAPLASEARPAWQWAPGLPDDGLRHSPDFTAADVSALTQTLDAIAASLPVQADGSAARLGNINAVLYAMAVIPTVFAQPDDSPAGTWEPATGLGVVDLVALAKYFPRVTGMLAVFVSGSATNYAPTHGQATTLMSSVSDISGQGGGVVPTGTVTFATITGVTVGTAPLVNGTATLTTKALPGGSVDVIASYGGDATYAPGQGYGPYLSVQGEPTSLSAAVAGSVPVGGTISVTVTATSTSGVGTPSGSISIAPQGIANTGTYTAHLTGSNGTATATVTFPATQAGTIALLVSCISADASFTCYSPVRATVLVSQLASTLSFTVSPNPVVTGSTTNFVGTVTGAAAPAPSPTGNVSFYDSGNPLGMVALVNGTATYSTALLTAGTHAFTASYAGDVNYLASNAASPGTAALVPTTTALTVSPNPPVSGSTTTLTATLGYASSGAAATGTVQFYEDGVLLGTGAVNGSGVATYTSTAISGATPHSFYAAYLGDTVYATSLSAAVIVGTTVTPVVLTVTPAASAMYSNPVTAMVSLSGVATTTGAGPAGSVVFTVAPASAGSTVLPLTQTVAIAPVSMTAGSASYVFAAPPPGTYTVTAACTGTNFSCATAAATAPLVTLKGSTMTTVTATPATVIAGQSTTLTATIVALSPLATAADFTGTVTFYNAGVSLGMGTLTAGQATLPVALTSATGNVITAVYSGDADWSASTSPALTLLPFTVPTTATLTASVASVLQGNNVVFSVAVADAPGTTVPPAGTVTFVDQYNGQTVPLGTVALAANGQYAAVAQLSTTGLFHGLHTVTATYAGNATLGTSSSSVTVNVTDYSIVFSPAALTLAQGASGTAALTVTSLNGFTGTVSLACTPPAGTATTCSFSSATVGANGSSTLTIGTTAPHAAETQQARLEGVGFGVSIAAVLGFMLLPRRRRPALLAVLVLCGLVGAAGCGSSTSAPPALTGGSPLGTQTFTVVSSGADGVSTTRHNVQFQVTIQ